MPNHDFLLHAVCTQMCYYGDVINSFDWISAIEHDGGI